MVEIQSDFYNSMPTHPGKKVPSDKSANVHRYIAAQGPLPHTSGDFWSMTLEEKSNVVLMLTPGIERKTVKCHQYYPSSEEPGMEFDRPDNSRIRVDLEHEVHFGSSAEPSPFQVTLQTLFQQYLKQNHRSMPTDLQRTILNCLKSVILRRVQITRFKIHNDIVSSSLCHHILYTGWPDHGVPDEPLELLALSEFYQFLSEYTEKEKNQQSNETTTTPSISSPGIIHCSAGVGRTGTFITTHFLTLMLHLHILSSSTRAAQVPTTLSTTSSSSSSSIYDSSTDLILACVHILRNNRIMMVQTIEQYQFCYKALLLWLEFNHPHVPRSPMSPRSARSPRSPRSIQYS